MSVITCLWAENPVLTKEMRVRMRGARAYWILTGYLLFLSFILFLQYTTWWSRARTEGGMSAGSKIGQEFFAWIMGTQAFLVAFITPAVTSGAITIEKEQRTMEMLEMTRLSRGSIVAGKLLSAISFIALLLVSSLPLTSICFFLGGVSPEQVVYWYLMLLVGSFVAGALGLMWSSIARTTSAAVIFTYGSLILPPILLLVFVGLSTVTSLRGGNGQTLELLFGIVISLFGFAMPDTASAVAPFFQWLDARHFYALTLPAWLGPVLTYSLIGLTLAAVAVARLETFPERRASMLRLLVALLFLQQTFFLFGARFAAYSGSAAPGLGALLAGSPIISVLIYPLLLLLLCIPIFSTGEIRTVEARGFGKYLLWGWTPAGWARARLASGLPYLFLLAVIILGMYWLSFVFIGQPGAALYGNVQVSGALPRVFAGIRAAAFSTVGGLIEVALVIFASVMGLASLGLLFSAVTRNRWAALALSYATLLMIFVAPLVSQAYYVNNTYQQSGSPGIFINLYYLNPIMAIAQMADTSGQFWNQLPLMYGRTPMWAVTTITYLFITGMALLLSQPFIMRIASRPALPYEDMAARA
jgi:ABC-type transport system involved in multi-copper enzyme maturation permease subunit